MLKEFREFINRGNVMDMAIGVIIGGAFGQIVSSLVEDILTPLISLLTGGVSFEHLSYTMGTGENAASLNYGMFIQSAIDFLIIAFVIFIMVKQINKLKRKEPAADPTTKICPYCKTEVAIDATRCPHCTSELQ